jgi:hypothetical protein
MGIAVGTASGEQMEPNAMTAARRGRPFDSRVTVTSLTIGQSVAKSSIHESEVVRFDSKSEACRKRDADGRFDFAWNDAPAVATSYPQVQRWSGIDSMRVNTAAQRPRPHCKSRRVERNHFLSRNKLGPSSGQSASAKEGTMRTMIFGIVLLAVASVGFLH